MNKIVKLVLLSVLLFTGIAQAQTVLIATTNSPNYGDAIIDNAYQEFVDYLGVTNVTDARSSLGTSATSPTPSFKGYDIVVVIAVYEQLLPAELSALETAINNKTDSTAFVLFFDGCDVCGQNADDMIKILNATNNAGITATLGTQVNASINYIATASPLAAGFPPSLEGYYYTALSGIPAGNVIYQDDLNSNDAGFVIPIKESKGSCLFGMTDTSLFETVTSPPPDLYASNKGKIAPAFVQAATDPNGACFLRGTPAQPGDARAIPSLTILGLLGAMIGLFAVAYRKVKK